MKIAFISFQWWFDKETAGNIYNKSKQMLRKNPDIVCPDDFLSSAGDIEAFKEKMKGEDIGCVIVQNGTFAPGDYLTKLVDTFKCPYILWAVPELETAGVLRFNSIRAIISGVSADIKGIQAGRNGHKVLAGRRTAV